MRDFLCKMAKRKAFFFRVVKMWRQILYHKRRKEMSRKGFGMRETMERASINCKKDRSISFMTPFQFGLETFRHSVTEKMPQKKK